MKWVSGGIVFFLRPHRSLLVDDGVRAGVDWESVVRIDGMVKLLLEMYQVNYLPIESLSMQERVRAVQFVLKREDMRSQRLLGPQATHESQRVNGSPSRGTLVAKELVASMDLARS
jgi:hypothetical protein